ncbi:MAG: hypothetical protein J5959_20940, partial [Butyrivibrio sp.]|nr:hypothetical protein [Butyrivibrio sp.]
MELQNQLSAYIYDKKFAPKIDYNLVMRRLQKQDKKTGLMRMSKTVFNNALTYTKFCMKKRLDVMPKDFKRMGDGSFTMYQGRMLRSKAEEADKLQETLENATITGTVNFQKFFEKFAELDSKHNKKAMSLFKKMAELTDVQVYMLVLILQDRTAIDYTTQDGWIARLTKKGVDYANIEKREQLKEELIRAEGMDKDFMRDLALTVTPEQFQKAAETMFSFQLRDDINLHGKSVGVSDFKKGALDRKTAVDWDMLHEAFNLLEEIESQNLKIQACRETVKHTGDPEMANKNARNAYKELEKYVKEENGTTDLGYFDDFIVREAKKNPDVAMPLISSFYKLSDNEKLLMFHALKHRDILDVSTEHTISTAIGLGDMDYVNAKGRDKLADYYIDHLSIAGAVNKLTTWDKDVYDAMRSLLSSQIDDTKDVNSVKTYADLVKDNVGTTRFVRRDTAVDWTLFANALKFVKRTETERQIFIGNKELYRSQGELSKYGRFQYNYKYLRQNMYSSGNRFTRFLGRRLKDEIMDAIPFSGPAQNILMGILSQENRNKMLEMGIVEDEEAKKKDKFTKIAGYGAMAGEKINMLGENKTISSVLKMSDNVAKGFSIAGEAIADYSKIMSGIWNIGNKFGELSDIKSASERSEKYEERDKKRTERAKQIQSQAQQKVTENIIERNKHILKDVASGVAQEAKREDIMDTVSEFVETLSGTGVGEQFIENYLFDKITNVVNEALKVTQFIMRLFVDKNMLKHYYDDDGPLADEANKLRTEGLKLRLQEQEKRKNSKKSILKDSELTAEDLKILENKSNVEIMQQAYGFSDFSEHAAYVGWNIVQTLIFTASPYNSNLQTKFQSFIIMTALGLKDLIGK